MESYKNPRLETGSDPIDNVLGGGIEHASITNFFGPAGAGKTNVALLATLAAVREGDRVAFIDTEGSFSTERLAQLADEDMDLKETTKQILIFEPTTFEEQHEAVMNLGEVMEEEGIGLIVIDSLVALYRLELGNGNPSDANNRLAEQMSYLSKLSREHEVPVVITNQIYSQFDSRDSIELVSRDIAKYWSKCLVELLKVDEEGKRMAVLRKHRSLPEGRQVQFEIREDGLEETKGFRLF